jgi:nucleolar complex protein 3
VSIFFRGSLPSSAAMTDKAETGYLESQLSELKKLHRTAPKTLDEVLTAMEKEVDLFVDMIPGYKIRSDSENQQVVNNKTVRAVQKVEHAMLAHYERYLTHVLRVRRSPERAVQLQAYECLCKLLPAAAHFNFGSSLITAVVMGCNEPIEEAARMCVAAVEDLLETDGTGDASLKVLNIITNLIKQHKHTVNPGLVATLIRLRITAMDVERPTTEERKKEQMKPGKRQTEMDQKIQRDLDRAQATPDQTQRRRTMTWILQRLMAAYLRLLEAAQDANGIRQHRLLIPVLEGLTKFAPLLDARMLNLLLTAIRDLLKMSHTHPLTALNAVVACCTLTECAEMASVLTNTAGDQFTTSAVAIDFGPAFGHLYRIIPEILSTPQARDLVSFRRERASTIKKAERAERLGNQKATPNDDTMSLASSMVTSVDLSHEYINACAERNRRVALLLKACEILLLKPKSLPPARVCAFAKLLSTYAVHQPPHIAMALMSFVRQLAQKRPYLADLIAEGPEANAGTGVYNPETEEPDHAHAEGAIFWEWCLLSKAYHPMLSRFAPIVQKTAPALRDPLAPREKSLKNEAMAHIGPLLRSTPMELLQEYDVSLGIFTPPITEPPTKKRRPNPADAGEDGG